jgi:hypothetical protein
MWVCDLLVSKGGKAVQACSIGGYHGSNLARAVIHACLSRQTEGFTEDTADDLQEFLMIS